IAHIRARRFDDGCHSNSEKGILVVPLLSTAAELLLLPEFAVTTGCKRFIEHCFVVAAVIETACRRTIGKLAGANEVSPPYLSRINAQLVSCNIHKAL